jgi:hypothetical protein
MITIRIYGFVCILFVVGLLAEPLATIYSCKLRLHCIKVSFSDLSDLEVVFRLFLPVFSFARLLIEL